MNKQQLALAGLAVLALTGLAAAQTPPGLTIPANQPVCNLYGLIQLFATVGGVIIAAYAGLQLATTHDIAERGNAKLILTGVAAGLIIVWLAPLVVQYLVGASNICGW